MDEQLSLTDSAAIKLLRLTWDGVTNKSEYSWRTLNSCMHDSLELAMRSQLNFYIDDITRIEAEFRWQYWSGYRENYYNLAVIVNNMSAIKALEYHWHREPFITDTLPHGGNRIRRQRLVVGSIFFWIGQRVTVTSFNDTKHQVIAVKYRKMPPVEKLEVLDRITGIKHHNPSPIEKIYRITNDELRGKKNG